MERLHAHARFLETTFSRGAVNRRFRAGEHPQTHAPHGQVRNGIDEMGEVAPEPVELPHHEQKVFAFVGRNVVSLPVDYW